MFVPFLQLQIWKTYIDWEKSNPLRLEDTGILTKRGLILLSVSLFCARFFHNHSPIFLLVLVTLIFAVVVVVHCCQWLVIFVFEMLDLSKGVFLFLNLFCSRIRV